ncbi:MAG: hypothetical protein GY835_01815 [bacterium]|nr:hypothetical protein [bacterium]
MAAEPIVIELEKYQDLLTAIKVTIGGETLPFLFDTGGGVTAITPELAQRLGLEPSGRITAWRKSGERLDLARCGELEFSLADHTLHAPAVLFNLKQLLPPNWPEVGGLLSLHSFQGRVITLDASRAELTIETPVSLSKRIASMSEMKIRFSRQGGGSTLDILVAAATPNGEIWLELDNSNIGPLLLAPHALVQAGLKRVADPTMWVGETTLDFVGLGPIDVQAEEHEMIYDGLINAATIEKLILTMDLQNGRMWGGKRRTDSP